MYLNLHSEKRDFFFNKQSCWLYFNLTRNEKTLDFFFLITIYIPLRL